MTRPLNAGRPAVLAAALALGVTSGLAGCSGGDAGAPRSAAEPVAVTAPATGASGATGASEPTAPVTQPPSAPAGSAAPTSAAPSATASSRARPATSTSPVPLPPGDPGLDAPSVPETVPTSGEHHDEPPRTVVPRDALLTAQSLDAVLGGRWAAASSPPAACAAPRARSAVAVRSAVLRSGPRMVVETVATYRTAATAESAVDSLAAALQACGWQPRPAAPLGEASAELVRTGRSSTDKAFVLAAEGVTVVLVSSGGASANATAWQSLADLALGSSCPAAPDGCH